MASESGPSKFYRVLFLQSTFIFPSGRFKPVSFSHKLSRACLFNSVKSKMKYIFFLYPGSDSDEAELLQDYLQGKLRNLAELVCITEISAQERDFRKEVRRSDCVVLVGSRQASSLIQNKREETDEDGLITFDGKFIHDEFTANKELVDKLIIVFLKERTKNDWIPTGFDEKRIFNLQGEKIRRGNPALSHLEHWIKRILGDKFL